MVSTTQITSVQAAIVEHYSQLSGALKSAADFIVGNEFDVATRSLRSIANDSELSPSSFSRLARALGFEDYEQLRESAREELAQASNVFTSRARELNEESENPLLPRQISACAANIQALLDDIKPAELDSAVESLASASKVVIVGSLGSAGFADYFAYLTSWFDGRWVVAGRNGITLASTLMRLEKSDAVIVISKAPYAKRAVLAAQMAAEHGASVISLTDSHTFPGLRYSNHVFIQKSESPQFFSSYAATLVLIETLAGMLVSRIGPQAADDIEKVMAQNQKLEEF